MEISNGNFTNPLEAVQIISIYSYLNTLSDFLFSANYLNESNLYQPIPVVNALYHFLDDNYLNQSEILEAEKINLAKKLIDSDFYGAKESETLDESFVNSLFKHIITSLVFEKYTNIYGFLVEIVNTTDNLTVHTFYDKILYILSEAKFQNEYGPDSTLEPIAIFKILEDFIYPLFPKPKHDLSLLSVDNIYAMAGAMFVLSVETPSVITPIIHREEAFDLENQFKKYVATAHAVEQSVLSGKVDAGALRIFTLPALLHYVHKEKEKLKDEKIANIISDPNHVSEAFRLLFSYLNNTFAEVEKARNEDYKYQFLLAVSNFKNRTTLAREVIINNECHLEHENDIDNEVNNYKNNPQNYECNSVNKSNVSQGITKKSLTDINQLYRDQVRNITEEFFEFEKKSIRDAFGKDHIQSLESVGVEISKGLFVYYYSGGASFDTSEVQLIKQSNDLFRFYFPDNKTEVFYALIRQDNDVTLIRESDNSELFRRKLDLYTSQRFTENNFPKMIKQVGETFQDFMTNIAKKRSEDFYNSLYSEGYDQTKKEWWIDFGLSFIPFYTCGQAINMKNVNEAEFACLLDAIFVIPVVGEIGSVVAKLTTATTRSLFSVAGTTFGSLALRNTLKETLVISGELVAKEAVEFSTLFTEDMFKKLGLSLFRWLDPGFELAFTIGKFGLGSIGNLLKVLEKYIVSVKSLKQTLMEAVTAISNLPRKVGEISGKELFVNSLSTQKYSGYGYKYIRLSDVEIAQIRMVPEFNKEMPVVCFSNPNGKVCRAVDAETGTVMENNLHLKDVFLSERYEPSSDELYFKSFHNSKWCGKLRRRRSPTGELCIRSTLQTKRESIEHDAVKYALENSALTETEVRTELKKYIFPEDGNMHLKFVQEWIDLLKKKANDIKKIEIPVWSRKYKIDDSEMFSRLRYADVLDKETLTKSEAVERVNFLYEKVPKNRIQYCLEPSCFTDSFINDRAYESVAFEDYYALKNYVGPSYKRMAETTIDIRRIKEALYRLAIRQSDDPIEEFSRVLYRGESRTPEVAMKLFFSGKQEIVFNRFISTSTSKDIAHRFRSIEKNSVNILYEMKFSDSYLRANLGKDLNKIEKETVLLPGSKFRIESVNIVGESFVEVKLNFMHEVFPKHEWYKKVMDELERLKNNVIAPYEIDPPQSFFFKLRSFLFGNKLMNLKPF